MEALIFAQAVIAIELIITAASFGSIALGTLILWR